MLALSVLVVLIAYTSSQPTASDNCDNYNQDFGYCLQCQEGFYLLEYFCAPCSPLCKCSSMNDYCQSCIQVQYQNYNVSSYYNPALDRCNLCNQSILYCISCTNTTTCLQCSQGKLVDHTTGQCSNTTCTDGCDICKDSSHCQVCQYSYYLNPSTKTCALYNCSVGNCLTCNSSSSCFRCEPTFYLSQNLCQSCLPNCILCQNVNSCSLCDPGYNFQQGSCQNNQLSNCVEYTSDFTTCLSCQPGYYISGGSCNQCSGCDLCVGGFLCLTQCQSGFTQFNYNCIPSSSESLTLGALLLILCVFVT